MAGCRLALTSAARNRREVSGNEVTKVRRSLDVILALDSKVGNEYDGTGKSGLAPGPF